MKHRYELPLFSFYDHTGVVRHLEQMARRGWRLDKLGGILWRYQPMEPRRLQYALVYFPEVSGFEPNKPEGHSRMEELCAGTGWTLAATAGKYQVYYNEDPDAVPLETDPGTQVAVIHRTMKRNFIPSYLILAVTAVLHLVMQITDLNKDYGVWYSGKAYYFSGFAWMMLPAWSVLLVVYLLELGRYFHWYRKAKARAGEGLYTPSPPFPVGAASGNPSFVPAGAFLDDDGADDRVRLCHTGSGFAGRGVGGGRFQIAEGCRSIGKNQPAGYHRCGLRSVVGIRDGGCQSHHPKQKQPDGN